MKIKIDMSKYDPNEDDGLTLLESIGVNWKEATRPLEDIQLDLANLYRDGEMGITEIEI